MYHTVLCIVVRVCALNSNQPRREGRAPPKPPEKSLGNKQKGERGEIGFGVAAMKNLCLPDAYSLFLPLLYVRTHTVLC